MQFKSLFFLISTTAAIVSASTLPDILEEISQLAIRVTTFQGLATAQIPLIGGVQQVMALNNSAVNVLDAAGIIADLLEALEDPVPADACEQILAACAPIEPVFQAGLQGAITQSSIVAMLGAGPSVGSDMVRLRDGIERCRVGVNTRLPNGACTDQINTLVDQMQDTLGAAIAIFNGQ